LLPRTWYAVLVEIAAIWIPAVLSQTEYFKNVGVAYYFVAEIAVVVLVVFVLRPRRTTLSPDDEDVVDDDEQKQRQDEKADDITAAAVLLLSRDVVTVYRSSMLLMTSIAILAVDFRVFPRRLAKTELHGGYSLMDVGAASFVVAAGLVSKRARESGGGGRSGSGSGKPKSALRRTGPILALGLLRLVTHKNLEYQEHASEYGVHWNFFFTLATLVPVAALTAGPTTTAAASLYLPVAAVAAYQLALSKYGLQEWVETAPRICPVDGGSFSSPTSVVGRLATWLCHLAAANREGLLGCIGYGALYLASEWIGYAYLWNNSATTKSTAVTTTADWFRLAGFLVFVWQLLESSSVANIPVSRRTTNAPFLVWVLALNVFLIANIRLAFQCCVGNLYRQAASSTAATTTKRQWQLPIILEAMNKHGLLIFVVSNLLTGYVNLSIPNTMDVPDRTALVILFLYASAIAVVAVSADSVLSLLSAITLPRRKNATTTAPNAKHKNQ